MKRLFIGLTAILLASGCASQFQDARAQGQLTACKSNLKNIGTSCEMYSTDYEGRYPKTTALLTPNYLKTSPECPAANADTYSSSYTSNTDEVLADLEKNDGKTELRDEYSFYCSGHHHEAVGEAENKPAYDSHQGIH